MRKSSISESTGLYKEMNRILNYNFNLQDNKDTHRISDLEKMECELKTEIKIYLKDIHMEIIYQKSDRALI